MIICWSCYFLFKLQHIEDWKCVIQWFKVHCSIFCVLGSEAFHTISNKALYITKLIFRLTDFIGHCSYCYIIHCITIVYYFPSMVACILIVQKGKALAFKAFYFSIFYTDTFILRTLTHTSKAGITYQNIFL